MVEPVLWRCLSDSGDRRLSIFHSKAPALAFKARMDFWKAGWLKATSCARRSCTASSGWRLFGASYEMVRGRHKRFAVDFLNWAHACDATCAMLRTASKRRGTSLTGTSTQAKGIRATAPRAVSRVSRAWAQFAWHPAWSWPAAGATLLQWQLNSRRCRDPDSIRVALGKDLGTWNLLLEALECPEHLLNL